MIVANREPLPTKGPHTGSKYRRYTLPPVSLIMPKGLDIIKYSLDIANMDRVEAMKLSCTCLAHGHISPD